MQTVIALTKPLAQQASWQAALEAEGYQVVNAPLIQTEHLPETAEQRAVWFDLDLFAGVIVVSPTAAAQLLNALDQYWPQPPLGVHWVCNGSGTAQVLLAGGLTPILYPTLGNRAEDVLALAELQEVQGRRWLIVAGEGGRDVTQPGLQARGAQVTRLSVYRRTPLTLAPAVLASLNQPQVIVQISSQVALDSLTSQASLVTKQHTALLLSSPRLVTLAEQAGWQRRVVAPGASLEATLQALNSLQETTS